MKAPPVWFWILAGLFLLWNAFGCYNYLFDVYASDATYVELYGEDMLAARALYPTWAVAAYALAVWSGLAAAVLLLLRRGLCRTLFAISLVSAAVCFIPSFISTALRDLAGPTFWVMPVIVVVMGLFQLWYARRSYAAGLMK